MVPDKYEMYVDFEEAELLHQLKFELYTQSQYNTSGLIQWKTLEQCAFYSIYTEQHNTDVAFYYRPTVMQAINFIRAEYKIYVYIDELNRYHICSVEDINPYELHISEPHSSYNEAYHECLKFVMKDILDE